MALARDRVPRDSSMGSKVIQSCVFNDTSMEFTSLKTNNGVNNNEYHKSVLEEEDGSQSTNGFSNGSSAMSHSPPTPLCGTANIKNGYVYKGTNTNYQLIEEEEEEEEEESLINFEATGYSNLIMQGSESLLSFQQNNNTNQGYNQLWNQVSPRSTTTTSDFSCFQTASSSGYSSVIVNNNNNSGKKQHGGGESSYGWLYSEQQIVDPAADSLRERSSGAQESVVLKKRPSLGDQNMKAGKKQQCTSESKTPTPKSGPSKDPQSVAAKNRRERISERLKILQELVPNGSKVDLVTMLEKAISYVKFLQLQVKVLATDEFWPVQGGKAPDISQVKEAIDAILLSSQRDTISSTSK